MDLNLAWSSTCEYESNQRFANLESVIPAKGIDFKTASPELAREEQPPVRALAKDEERDELSISCFACNFKMKGKNIGKGFRNFGKGFAEICQGIVNVATLCIRPQ